MSELRLAGNFINDLWNYVFKPVAGGHFQVVFVPDDGTQMEIEVQPRWDNLPLLQGRWKYPPDDGTGKPQKHDEITTPEIKHDPFDYRYATIDLGDRSADKVWDILTQVHEQFDEKGQNIPYIPLAENSNTYATTLLSVVGVDINQYAALARPVHFPIVIFPGQGINILENEKYAIALNLKGTDKGDIIHTGVKSDTLSGFAGNDELSGGGGEDTLDGGANNDILDGGLGDDTMTGGTDRDVFDVTLADTNDWPQPVPTPTPPNIENNDKILDFNPQEDSILFPKGTINERFINSDTVLTHPEGTVSLVGIDLSPEEVTKVIAGEILPREQAGTPPEIGKVETFREGDFVFFKLSYTDPNGDAEGFGFRGINGSGWAEETHPFSSPSYGRVSSNETGATSAGGTVEYPFNHLCTTGSPYESDVEAWVYDRAGLSSTPVAIHLACSEPGQVIDPVVPWVTLGGSSELDPIGGTAM